MTNPIKNIEYMCSYCGQRVVYSVTRGRPQPGQCPRKSKDSSGKYKPHTWVVNRKW